MAEMITRMPYWGRILLALPMSIVVSLVFTSICEAVAIAAKLAWPIYATIEALGALGGFCLFIAVATRILPRWKSPTAFFLAVFCVLLLKIQLPMLDEKFRRMNVQHANWVFVIVSTAEVLGIICGVILALMAARRNAD